MTTENTAVAENNTEEVTEKKLVEKPLSDGTGTIYLDEIADGQWAGFKFWVPNFKTLSDAEKHFTTVSKNGKPGGDLIVNLINAALAFRMRSRAQSKLTIPAKIDGKPITSSQKEIFLQERAAWKNDEEKVILVSEEDANDYVPGEREVDSLSGLLRQKMELLKAIKAAKTAGNNDEAKAQAIKYGEVSKLIEEKQKKEQDEVLALLD